MPILIVFSSIIGYLVGSLSSAVVVCKLMRLPDPREHGSNNPGATNVMRIGGKKASYLTFAGDFLKGFLPVALVSLIFNNNYAIAFTAFGAFLGHLYPVYFGFRGGKGVATFVGVIIAISPLIFLVFGVIWLMLFYTTSMVSIASIIAAASTIVSAILYSMPVPIIMLLVVLNGLILFKHKTNIKDIISGKERSFKKK